LQIRLGKNFRTKKKNFWPVSDLDPNPRFVSGLNTGFESGFESGFGSDFESRSESETNFRPDLDPKLDPKLLFRISNTASNEHILDKVMVKNRGLNHSYYKDVSPVTHLLTCSLF
jgi:hypothetical protein